MGCSALYRKKGAAACPGPPATPMEAQGPAPLPAMAARRLGAGRSVAIMPDSLWAVLGDGLPRLQPWACGRGSGQSSVPSCPPSGGSAGTGSEPSGPPRAFRPQPSESWPLRGRPRLLRSDLAPWTWLWAHTLCVRCVSTSSNSATLGSSQALCASVSSCVKWGAVHELSQGEK